MTLLKSYSILVVLFLCLACTGCKPVPVLALNKSSNATPLPQATATIKPKEDETTVANVITKNVPAKIAKGIAETVDNYYVDYANHAEEQYCFVQINLSEKGLIDALEKIVELLNSNNIHSFDIVASLDNGQVCSVSKDKDKEPMLLKNGEITKITASQSLQSVKIAQTEASQGVVFATASGKKYHTIASCSNMTQALQMTLDEALAKDLQACKRCKNKN